MTERTDVYAYFWVQGFKCTPEELSATLGFSPTSIESVRVAPGGGKPDTSYMWLRQSPLPRGDTLIQDHIEALLEVLEPHHDAVASTAKICDVGINCVGYYYGTNPGLHLSASLVARLATLNLPVDFDLYNYSEASRAA
jgi:hypothetical protein